MWMATASPFPRNPKINTRIQFNYVEDIDVLSRSLVENASGQPLESLDIGDVNAFLNELTIFHSTEDETWNTTPAS